MSQTNQDGATTTASPSEASPTRRRMVDVLRELETLALECQMDNWDGEGAQRVVDAEVERMRRMLGALPDWCPTPEVSVDAAGSVLLEWSSATRGSLLVSTKRPRGFAFAWAHAEATRAHGGVEGPEDLPPTLLAVITVALMGSP